MQERNKNIRKNYEEKEKVEYAKFENERKLGLKITLRVTIEVRKRNTMDDDAVRRERTNENYFTVGISLSNLNLKSITPPFVPLQTF